MTKVSVPLTSPSEQHAPGTTGDVEPHIKPGDVESEEEIRGIAAIKFDAVDVDWNAFNAENSLKRGQEDAVWNRMLQVIMAKSDAELTEDLRKNATKEALNDQLGLIDRFNEHAAHLHEGAKAFELGAMRMMVATYRVLYGLDRDGNPLPQLQAEAGQADG